jgi:hypothetical protein
VELIRKPARYTGGIRFDEKNHACMHTVQPIVKLYYVGLLEQFSVGVQAVDR